MDAGLLDVLHDAADDDVRAVGDDVDVDLDGVGQELVDEDGRVLLAGARRQALAARGLHGRVHEVLEARRLVDDLHGAAAEHVRGAHHDRVADALGDLARLGEALGRAPGGRAQVELLEQLAEALAVLGAVDGVGARAEELDARVLQRHGQAQRRLPAELDDDALGLLDVEDLEHVLARERLEVQPVGRVVVGRHRLGVAVDHDRLVAVLAQRLHGVDAAVVELDALADAVGPAAEDDDLLLARRARFTLDGDDRLAVDGLLLRHLVRRVHVRRLRLELGGAGVDALEDGADAVLEARLAHLLLRRARDLHEAAVGHAEALAPREALGVVEQLGAELDARVARRLVLVDERAQLREEPRIDLRELEGLLVR